jgi:osmoprotectant transport system permease protein
MDVIHFLTDNLDQCWFLTWEHVWLVGMAVFLAILIGVPVGVAVTYNERAARVVISTANVFMTTPSIALFGVLIPVFSLIDQGLGKVPAVTALILYSQLPIIRNTHTAIQNVPPELVEAARGLGMSKWRRLREIEIPLAVPVIIGGLRTAAVMSIGIAAIAAYIGAGGLGVLIQQGIARVYDEMILAGALLVSVLAIFVDGAMSILERIVTPRGIQLEKRQQQ